MTWVGSPRGTKRRSDERNVCAKATGMEIETVLESTQARVHRPPRQATASRLYTEPAW
jgi:hypothetical protein